jgi:hypothetical protein
MICGSKSCETKVSSVLFIEATNLDNTGTAEKMIQTCHCAKAYTLRKHKVASSTPHFGWGSNSQLEL